MVEDLLPGEEGSDWKAFIRMEFLALFNTEVHLHGNVLNTRISDNCSIQACFKKTIDVFILTLLHMKVDQTDKNIAEAKNK